MDTKKLFRLVKLDHVHCDFTKAMPAVVNPKVTIRKHGKVSLIQSRR
jgi:hypothetical protein